MPSVSHIKARIHGIASTKHITQAMHLVSASKMLRARQRYEDNRAFAEESERFIQQCVRNMIGCRHPYIDSGAVSKKPLYIVLGSDRGLCGGFLVNVCRLALALHRETGGCLLVCGAKTREFFRKRVPSKVVRVFTGKSETPFFEDAEDIAYTAIDMFNKGEADRIVLVYTEFISVLIQTPRSQQLLPLSPSGILRETAEDSDSKELFTRSTPFALAAAVYGRMLESAVCEQSARVTSMDTACKNAGELMEKLSHEHNKIRQGYITQELVEIIGGVDALTDE